MNIHHALSYASMFSIVLPIAGGLYSYRNHTAGFRLLFLAFVISALSDQVNSCLAQGGHNNHWVFNIYCLCEGTLFIYVMATWLKKNKEDNILRTSITAGFILLWMLTTFYKGSITEYNSIASLTEGVMLMVLSSWLLYNLSNSTKTNILTHPKFYMASGTLLYFASSFVIFGTLDYLIDSGNGIAFRLYAIHSFFGIIANMAYFAGYILKSHRT